MLRGGQTTRDVETIYEIPSFYVTDARLGGERRGGHARRIPGRDDGWEKARSTVHGSTYRNNQNNWQPVGARGETRAVLRSRSALFQGRIGAALPTLRPASINGDSPMDPFFIVDGLSQFNFLCGAMGNADVRGEGIRGAGTGHVALATAKCKDRRGNERIALFYFY